MLNCSRPDICFTDFVKCHGDEIFFIAIALISALLVIVIALVITICCLCRRRKRKYSLDADAEEETNSGKKGDAFRLAEVEGEAANEGEKSKMKTMAGNVYDRKEETRLENFAEAMYATVESTNDQPIDGQTKQGCVPANYQNVDLTVDGDNYDIITHVEEDKSAPGKQPNQGSSGKSTTTKAAKKSKEKKTAPEMVVAEAEYSVPDKALKKKKQKAQTASTNLELMGGTSTSAEYNMLLHVTSNAQRLSMQVPAPNTSEYSVINQKDSKRNSSLSDIGSSNCQNGRQRGRTSSPPELPPPLPPPFVDEENPIINNTRINAQEELALYDDPDSLAVDEPPQEMYMNVGKR